MCPVVCFRRPLWPALVLALLLLAGCDTAAEEAVCPPAPGPQEAAYFPLETGTTWRYDYTEASAFDGSATSEARTGELTWTLDAVTCEDDLVRLTLAETFAGVDRVIKFDGTVLSEHEVSWTKPVTARLAGMQLTISGYTNRLPELRWVYPAAEPDTVRVQQLHAAGFGTVDETIVWIKRGEGLIQWFDGQAGRVTNFRSFRLKAN